MVKASVEIRICGARPKEERYVDQLIPKSGTTLGCGRVQPKYIKLGVAVGARFTLPVTVDRAPIYNPFVVYSILHAIRPEHAIALGFDPTTSRVSNCMIWNLHTPSPLIRFPVVPNEASRNRGEDDATLKLAAIVKIVQKLRVALESEKVSIAMFPCSVRGGVFTTS